MGGEAHRLCGITVVQPFFTTKPAGEITGLGLSIKI
jgi:C4-dicarboxylate-specific signal transduction histidine kinase